MFPFAYYLRCSQDSHSRERHKWGSKETDETWKILYGKKLVWTSDHGIIEKQRLEVSKFLGNHIVNEKMSLDLKVFDSEGLEAILESPNWFTQEVGFKSHAVLKDNGLPNIP